MTKPAMPKKVMRETGKGHFSPFEQIRRTNDAGNEFWSSRDFAKVLDYSDYRNFEQVIEKARTACFNRGHQIDGHFVDVTDMIEVGNSSKRPAESENLYCYIYHP